MDSQVACLAFWWGLQHVSPRALLEVVRAFAPEAVELVAPAVAGVFVEPEWIGRANYLGERGRRRRGRYATSADALIAWRDARGQRHGALIESKYGESYGSRDLRWSKRGTDRLGIYGPLAAQPWFPLRRDVPLEALMYEPFDQHMRQQLLAAAMEAAGELDLRTVRLVHVAPRANRAFHEGITAPALVGRGATVAEVWSGLLVEPERYLSLAYEDLVGVAAAVGGAAAGEVVEWRSALRERYGWAA